MSIAREFIQFSIDLDVLKFGDFTLKSGRQSPYFFNAGLFNTASSLKMLGEFYADVIIAKKIQFDVLFGPAYKGIPLATATAVALANKGVDIAVCFDRKEAKSHGEKGQLIGSDLQGKRVLIIDDVITQGTAFRHSQSIITEHGGQLTGLVIALDRMEKNAQDEGVISSIKSEFAIDIFSIASIKDILLYLETHSEVEKAKTIKLYLDSFGV